MKKEISHEGHRQRLKNRFLTEGLSNFEKHNILELLLFYSIPRRDTNEIAHALIERFGSLHGVFDADFSELVKVKGISENTATLIKMIPQISKEYLLDENSPHDVFDTATKIGDFFVKKYIGETKEIVYAMLLNAKFEIIAVPQIFEGSINSVQVTPRKILDEIMKYNASMVVLAHNHPSSTTIPSMEDIDTTSMLISAFDTFNIPIIEHFIVSGNSYRAIIHETSSLRRLTENSNKLH